MPLALIFGETRRDETRLLIKLSFGKLHTENQDANRIKISFDSILIKMLILHGFRDEFLLDFNLSAASVE